MVFPHLLLQQVGPALLTGQPRIALVQGKVFSHPKILPLLGRTKCPRTVENRV